MHKPILIIQAGSDETVAKLEAERYIDKYLVGHEYFDYYQSIHDWLDFKDFDKPIPIENDISVKSLKHLIEKGKEQSLYWIREGNKDLLASLKEADNQKSGISFNPRNFSWALDKFHLATSKSTFWVFDNTGWSYSYVADMTELEEIIRNAQGRKKLWVVGFDAHF